MRELSLRGTLVSGIVTAHPVYITDNKRRLIGISPSIPLQMSLRVDGQWSLEDFDLIDEIYRGKASLVYKVSSGEVAMSKTLHTSRRISQAIDRPSGAEVCLKVYRKKKLTTLNRSVITSQCLSSRFPTHPSCIADIKLSVR